MVQSKAPSPMLAKVVSLTQFFSGVNPASYCTELGALVLGLFFDKVSDLGTSYSGGYHLF